MNEQLGVKTSYLVMVGKLFVSNLLFISFSKELNNAKEFDYDTAKQLSSDIGGVVVRKTVEYEEVQND